MQRNNENTDQTGTQTTSTTNTTESGTQTPAKKRLNLRAAIDQPNTSNIDLDATSNEVEADLAKTSNTDLDDISNEVDLVNTSNTDLDDASNEVKLANTSNADLDDASNEVDLVNTSNIDPYAAPVTAKPKNSAKTPSSTTPIDPDAPITFEPNQLQTGVHISHDLRIPPNNHSRDDFDQLADNVDNAFENSTPYYQSLLRTIRATIAKNPEKFSNQRYSLLVIQNDNGEDEEYFLIKRADRKSAEKSKLSFVMGEKLKRSSLLGAGCFGTVKAVVDVDGNLFAVKKVKVKPGEYCPSGEKNDTIREARHEYLFYHNRIRPLLEQYPELQDHIIIIKHACETLNSKARPTIYQIMELAQGDLNDLIVRLYPSEGKVLLTEETENAAFAAQMYTHYRQHHLITDPVTYKNLMLYLMASVIKTFAQLEKYGIFLSDIKPDNLLFANGLFKAADMGGAAHIVDGQVLGQVSSKRDYRFCSPPEVAASEDFNGQINQKIEAWSVGLICLFLIYGKVRKYREVHDSERESTSKFHADPTDPNSHGDNNPKFIMENRQPGGKELIDFFRWAECDFLKNYDYKKFLELIKNLPKNPETEVQDKIIEELLSRLITMTPEERDTLEEADKYLDEELRKMSFDYSTMKRLCAVILDPTLEKSYAAKSSFSITTSGTHQPSPPRKKEGTLRKMLSRASSSILMKNPDSDVDRPSSSMRSSTDVITIANGKVGTSRIDTSENNNNRPTGLGAGSFFRRTISSMNLRGTPKNDVQQPSLSSSTNKK